jgi:hypothetical protein
MAHHVTVTADDTNDALIIRGYWNQHQQTWRWVASVDVS